MNNDPTVLQGRQEHTESTQSVGSFSAAQRFDAVYTFNLIFFFFFSISSLMGVVWGHSIEMLELSLGQN